MRTVEIYTGAYASGKSENAINRAISYIKENKEITLVDLDTVEPAYCMRPLEKQLREMGIDLILQSDYFGLGEAGSYVTNEQINCLKKSDKDIVIDVGYGVTGLDTLDILNDIDKEENIKIYLVVNTSKFETRDVESILEYIQFNSGENAKPWKKISGLISHTPWRRNNNWRHQKRIWNSKRSFKNNKNPNCLHQCWWKIQIGVFAKRIRWHTS